MLFTAVAPEIVLAQSTENFSKARSSAKYLKSLGKEGWTLTHLQFANAEGFKIRLSNNEHEECKIEKLVKLIEKGEIDHPPITEDELRSRGKSDIFVKLIALTQIVWFIVQTLFRAIQHYPLAAIEIMTVAFVLCSIFTYGLCFNQPQDVEYPVYITRKTTVPVEDDRVPDFEGTASVFWLLVMFLSACGFGGIHFLAWNSPFPTSKESLAWRICSVVTTVLPIPCTLSILGAELWFSDLSESFSAIVFFFLVAVYALGRLTLIALSFTTLRALPADAFQTVNWNHYFPHFAA